MNFDVCKKAILGIVTSDAVSGCHYLSVNTENEETMLMFKYISNVYEGSEDCNLGISGSSLIHMGIPESVVNAERYYTTSGINLNNLSAEDSCMLQGLFNRILFTIVNKIMIDNKINATNDMSDIEKIIPILMKDESFLKIFKYLYSYHVANNLVEMSRDQETTAINGRAVLFVIGLDKDNRLMDLCDAGDIIPKSVIDNPNGGHEAVVVDLFNLDKEFPDEK